MPIYGTLFGMGFELWKLRFSPFNMVEKIKEAFFSYRYTEEMKKAFDGADRFFPITYQKDWAVIRDIADATGASYNEEGLKAMIAKEKADAEKKEKKQ